MGRIEVIEVRCNDKQLKHRSLDCFHPSFRIKSTERGSKMMKGVEEEVPHEKYVCSLHYARFKKKPLDSFNPHEMKKTMKNKW